MPADIAVQRTIEVGEPPIEAQQRFMGYFTTWMAQGGFQAQATTPGSISFIRRSFNTWQVVVAVLFFPIGLLALLSEKHEHRLDVLFQASDDDATTIMLTGSVPQKVCRQLADQIDVFDPDITYVGEGRY